MRYFFLLLCILLFPLPSMAEYKFYLKNGSVTTGTGYETKGNEIIIQLDDGHLGIPLRDILKIEETSNSVKAPAQGTIQSPKQEGIEVPLSSPGQEITEGEGSQERSSSSDNTARLFELRDELNALDSDIKSLEEEEKKTQQSIDTMSKRRFKYNRIQMMQLQNDLEPLQQQLYSTQQKKRELLQRKTYLQGEMNALEHQ
jgi:uncharacterized protein YdcH (DUF465 family)